MEFNPNNNIIRLCLQGRALDEKGKPEEAGKLFLQAWHEARYDFEKFISAYYVAWHQKKASDKLQWLETTIQIALNMKDDSIKSAFPLLYSNLAKCYEDMGNADQAKKYHELAASFNNTPADTGPFYHGTKADLQIGEVLTAKGNSNYRDELKMNHVYFTALVHGAGLAAALAKGNGRERVYIVEPTGSFENDPNVTNNYFPGNLTRSYRSEAPLKIVGEVTDAVKLSPEERQIWRERLARSQGEIIN